MASDNQPSSLHQRKGQTQPERAALKEEHVEAEIPSPRSPLRSLIRNSIISLCLGYFAIRGYETFFPTTSEDLLGVPAYFQTEPSFPAPVLTADVEKRDAIKEAFLHSWHAYERDAWGNDDYHPISRKGDNISESGGIGYTIIDTLDTLLVMGLTEEYERARDWVANSLTFDVDVEFNAFELTIRLLGGLLSAHHLSPNPADAALYLTHAKDLADRLLTTFETPSGIPLSKVNLKKRKGLPDLDNRGAASLAEVGSMQLEMKYLSELTGDRIYWDKVERVMDVIRNEPSMEGLYPILLSTETGGFFASEIRLGSRGDSYYEYLIKQYLQTDGHEPVYRQMYDGAMQGIKHKLIYKTKASQLLYTAELGMVRDPKTGQQTWRVNPKQDHLVCFLGGSLLLGVTEARLSVPPNLNEFSQADMEDWITGTELIKTCVETYNTKTGLAPEIAFFYNEQQPESAMQDWYIKKSSAERPLIDARNILRPETVESLFLAFRLTGDPTYREHGWKIFQAFQEHCRIETGGYVSVLDVNQVPVEHEDRMETFWLSETLKYLYLLFSDADVIPLRDNVFNTEAHILPVFKPTVKHDI
ncbi:glycoside hydrolase family 47 protein [Phaffia rhodozyma]|uniref:alpha-1,2-Mannosidase n=1 Tax=Phaffia rhodozyma TaxID=264483 RepID=A0A0F7SNW2_PHARH|nr:glycoside hydrolase family 47 protein [Phaffia rhodozyma]